MERLGERNRPGFGYHLKVHTFRTLTAVLAWGLIVTAFYQKPELLTSAQRLMQRGIEAVGDAVPSPWGARMEFVFREIGGLIWLQITDHHGDTHASHGAVDDRGDVAAHLPSNRPKQSMGDERSSRPSSIRCPNLGFFCVREQTIDVHSALKQR
jgi:hypothetical protein